MTIIKRIAAILCAGLLLAPLPVHAKEETAPVLPSGNTVEYVQRELGYYNCTTDGELDFVGALAGIFQGDEVLYTGYYGYSDFANRIPADEESCFEWGSITKTLIWVSAMQLWEQDRLDLNRDVREYLPEGFFQHLSYDDPITMLHLMNHTAGWQETTRSIAYFDENSIPELPAHLQSLEPQQINPPGAIAAYSNYGAAVAGYVIECITGESFCDYVHAHIFEPLGMEHTAILPAQTDNDFVYRKRRTMHSYSLQSMIGRATDEGAATGFVPAYPAGAACGTLDDMMHYGQALVDDAAPLFEHPETQEFLFTGTDFYGESDIPINCHGFWCEEHAVRCYGHSGATMFGQANLVFDPVSKVGLAVMVNEPDGNVILERMPELVFGNLNPETYGSETFGKAEIRGYYTMARSTYRGMLRFVPYLSAVSLDGLFHGNVQHLKNGVVQVAQEGPGVGDGVSAALLGEKRDPKDKLTALETPSCDLLPDPFFLLHLSLLTGFVLTAVAAIYMLLIRRKLKRAGRFAPYAGAGIMTAGRLARIGAVFLWLATYAVYSKYIGGIPQAFGTFIGLGQLLCAGICTAGVIVCIVSLLKNKQQSWRYILHSTANVICVAAITYYEMYRFWVQ